MWRCFFLVALIPSLPFVKHPLNLYNYVCVSLNLHRYLPFLDIDVLLKKGNVEMSSELLYFKEFKQKIVTEELNEQFSIIHELSRVLSTIVTANGLPDLLLTSLKGLNDSQLASTSGTCVVLNGEHAKRCSY